MNTIILPSPAEALRNPFTRRALYKKAHRDPRLAAWIRENDPKYATRASLTRFEKIAEDVIVVLMIIPASVLETIVGSLLDLFEKDGRRDGRIRLAYEELKYNLIDPFHRKRELYTLPK